jgi:ectonucleotide pyrophosphatase/phosphodiesterase family member 5
MIDSPFRPTQAMFRILLLLVCSVFISSFTQFKTATEFKPVLLISFDGFRPDYIDLYDTPNLDLLIHDGVRAESMIPVYPTKTFPNHYSIVTGLYTENTGLIANTMYDEEFQAFYSLANRAAVQNARWYGGEPIWVTTEKQGKKAGVLFWPGSEAPIKGQYASHWKVYEHEMDYTARVDTIIHWLSLPKSKRVDFVAMYFDAVDSYGHYYGVGSDSVEYAVQLVDQKLGYLIDELKRVNIWPNIDIIITSDHGMTNASNDRLIFLDEIIDLNDVIITDWNPVAMIRSKEGKHSEVIQKLRSAQKNYRVYSKEELPDRFRMKNNPRVPDIVVEADLGYTITSSSQYKERGISPGVHGYDNQHPDMQAIFLAHGPSFKRNLIIPPFQNIHVYELLSSLLNLQAAPNDGSADSLKHILR